MKYTFKTFFMGMSLMTLFSCQQVNPVNDQPFTTVEATGNELSCPGSDNLNCFIDFPTNNTTIDQIDFTQSYVACMDACLPGSCTDGGGDIIDEASDECPTQFSSCDAQCSLTSSESPIAGIPDSDGVTLPENSKAILVEVTACFTTRRMNEVQFRGTDISIVSQPEGKYIVNKSGGFLGIGGTKSVQLGFGAGRNFNCPDNLKNKAIVVSKPQSGTSLTLGSNTVTITPFSNTAVVTKSRALPHSLNFSAISAEMKEEMDLKNVVVIPKSFGTPSPSIAHAFNDWRYYNNSDLGYGTTVLFAGFFFEAPFTGATSAATQTMSAYIFASAAEE
jgi:hypothetical protein